MAAVTLTRDELEAAVFQLERGDLLVVRVAGQLTQHYAHQLTELLQTKVPDGVEALVLDESAELDVYRAPTPE